MTKKREKVPSCYIYQLLYGLSIFCFRVFRFVCFVSFNITNVKHPDDDF